MLNRILFGSVAISLLASQANAGDTKKPETKWQCEKKAGADNSCSSADASCSGHAEKKEVLAATNKKDCKTQGGEWKKVIPEHKKS